MAAASTRSSSRSRAASPCIRSASRSALERPRSAGAFFFGTLDPMKAISSLGLLALLACGPATGSPALVLKGVTVIDMIVAAPRPGMTVVVRDGRIEAVSSEASVPEGARVVDARGKFLIPGLWDMHVHLWASRERLFPLFLANGVTGVRDMASPPGQIFRLREEVRSGKVLGPRIVACGPQVDGPGQAPGYVIPVGNAEEARQAVRSLKKIEIGRASGRERV